MPTPDCTTTQLIELGKVETTSLEIESDGRLRYEIESDGDSLTVIATQETLQMLAYDAIAAMASERASR